MYSSNYSHAKFGQEAREPLHKSKGKSCGYYMRIIFFFSSLIQSLIIISLVLFLIYGQPEKSAVEKRVEELELSFNRLSENNIQLMKEKGELGAQLEACKAEKASLEKEMEKLKNDANSTQFQLKFRLSSCERMSATTLSMMARRPTPPIQAPAVLTTSSEVKTLQSLNAQQKAMISLIEANFTQTVHYLSQERDNALKDRDTHHQDAISMRKENTVLKEQLVTYTGKCKEDFAESLNGITIVTKDFLNRINNLFPHQLTFHLTCDSQQEQMEKIRNSCTNLSRDVENKFQLYLDNVGNKVAEIQAKSSRMEVQNLHLISDLQQCEHKHSEMVAEAAKEMQLKQKTHDDQVEKLLMEQNRLREQKKLQEDNLALREKELKILQQMLPAQPSFKSGVPKTSNLQAAPQQDRGTVPNWPFIGAQGRTSNLHQ
ncbi:plasmalemma vesicle associated protein b [Echeneis naucrates]|uniref:Plasmalemma vesicle associated protein b n=1 Tax=Echeneis naucrates TaxID=173247 RepID=A0A665WUK1_ECHNA|nr:plasmalemma vesicle-associated protein [Echeneis naucrates]